MWFHQGATISELDTSGAIAKSYISPTEYHDMSLFGSWAVEVEETNNEGKYIHSRPDYIPKRSR